MAMRQQMVCRHEHLFVGHGRRRVGHNSLSTILEEIKAIAGMRGDPRIKPHSIRHAAATRLMRNGADIRSIQAWLGHSDLKTTAIYLHTDEHQVRKIANLAGLQSSEGNGLAAQGEEKGRGSEARQEYFRHRRRGPAQ
jgi:site-specific recombinase XerD